MSLRHPWFVGSLVCAVASGGIAQNDLAARIAAAANTINYSLQLQQLGCDKLPVGDVLDALLAARQETAADRWPFVLSQLLSRRQDLERCWREQPDQRQSRAELFAAFFYCDWVHGHRRADAEERSDIEAVAAWLRPGIAGFEHWLRSDDAALRASAERLAHCVAAAVRNRPLPTGLALLRRLTGSATEMRQVSLPHGSGDPGLVLEPLLRSSNNRVVARAAAALRKMCGWPLTPSLESMLADDPAPGMCMSILLSRPLQEADVPRIAAMMSDDGPPPLSLLRNRPEPPFGNYVGPTMSALPVSARRSLAKAAIAVGLRMPANPPPDPQPPHRGPGEQFAQFVRSSADERAAQFFAFAAALDPLAAQMILAHSLQTEDAEVALRLLDGLRSVDMRSLPIRLMAPLVVELRQHREPKVAAAATHLATALLEQQREPVLLQAVTARARTAVAEDVAHLRVRLQLGPDETVLGPEGIDAEVVLAAAKAGDAGLLPPLLAELQRFVPAGKPLLEIGDRQHAAFLLQAVAYLATAADDRQSEQLFDLLRARLGTEQATGRTRLHLLVGELLFWLYARNSAQHEEWYGDLLWLLPKLSVSWQPQWYETLNEPRLRRLLARPELQNRYPPAWLRVPDLLAAMFADDGTRATAVQLLARCFGEHTAHVHRLLEERSLPDALVAAAALDASAAVRNVAPLSSNEATFPAELVGSLAWRLGSTIPAPEAAELPHLRRFCGWRSNRVAVAAARRAAQLGEAGSELCHATLARLFTGDDPEAAVSALETAVALDLELPDLESRLQALAKPLGEPTAVETAARLRFLQLPLSRLQPRDLWALVLSGVDADADTLRRLLGRDAQAALHHLLGSRSPATRTAALAIAAEQPVWSVDVERDIVGATADPLPEVRGAAYRALGTRDPELWSCALLVYEAAVDPDPTVRALGR